MIDNQLVQSYKITDNLDLRLIVFVTPSWFTITVVKQSNLVEIANYYYLWDDKKTTKNK